MLASCQLQNFIVNGCHCLIHDFLYVNIHKRNTSLPNRFNLKGPYAGTMNVFADNLPGLPCKITRSSQGGFWVGFVLSRLKGRLDRFYKMKSIRKLFINVRLLISISSVTCNTPCLLSLILFIVGSDKLH